MIKEQKDIRDIRLKQINVKSPDEKTSRKRILITAGGTGGHLFPAQALASELLQEPAVSDVLFAAGGLKTNRFFDRNQFAYQEVVCSPLMSLNPLKILKGAVDIIRGYKQGMEILKNFRPDAVVGFGSYYTVPMILAARRLNIPIVLHEANSVPGRANQWLASLADCVGLHFPSAASFFSGKTAEVGLPLRKGYQLSAVDKKASLDYYGLSADKRTLLICGGSQGARAINQLIEECLPVFKSLDLQLIHLTGDAKKTAGLTELYAAHQIPACIKSFEDRMEMAWRVADVFVGRSGASTVAESIEFEVPGILIPYPHATGRHQEKNADHLVQVVGAGIKLLEQGLTSEELRRAIAEIFHQQQHFLFLEALKKHKKRPHQQSLCHLILHLENKI